MIRLARYRAEALVELTTTQFCGDASGAQALHKTARWVTVSGVERHLPVALTSASTPFP